ncbi:MAG: GTPase ObgE [Elusimicrobia bacterium]|nr:GTPase ObgE [Elusimicrobiota bacterium]
MKSLFVDRVKIFVKGGRGGDGCLSFRREKFVPRGGPDGGDGGRGGSVFLVASSGLATLYDFKFHPHYKAKSGGHGGGSCRNGRTGEDIRIKVPCGTEVVRDGVLIGDLIYDGDELCVARGGKGGRGNAFFKSATNRAPRKVTPGEDGETAEIFLRLKLIADVGFVGFPNAGKSTLLGRISSAHPKIADYPFTTLKPNLGVVNVAGDRITFADLPGIVEDAHLGKGLGFEFLAHLERVKLLLFVIDVFGFTKRGNPYADFEILEREVKEYSPFLLEKPVVIALNKMDIPGADKCERNFPEKHFCISAAEGRGLDSLVEFIRERLCETSL